MRALELYAGIGGFAAASRGRVEIACAIEQSDVALSVYSRNYPHRTLARNITGLRARDLASFDADLWWMSPPCQPYTRRGKSRDLEDQRTKSFLTLIDMISEVRPRYVALENVPELRGSEAHTRLLRRLEGYRVIERVLCPTELGVPNRRARYYLVASRDRLEEMKLETMHLRLADLIERPGRPDLRISEDTLQRYRHAMSILDPDDPQAIASCFTGAYGRSPIQSGSFLAAEGGVRRFSPDEILALLGFPRGFSLPVPLERAYQLIGNSLSVYAVRAVLSAIPMC